MVSFSVLFLCTNTEVLIGSKRLKKSLKRDVFIKLLKMLEMFTMLMDVVEEVDLKVHSLMVTFLRFRSMEVRLAQP